jgi:2',3'-cyclic-nucleotide 2'-phosphodiesterase (5'-nucleotidase family)
MQTALIIVILTAFILQGVIILGVLKLSLKWQIQAKNNVLPTVDNPIKKIVEEKKLEQKIQQYKNVYDEYLNGDPKVEGK